MKKQILNFIALLFLATSLSAGISPTPALVVPVNCSCLKIVPPQNTLPAGQSMTKGQRLTSLNGKYFLNYQHDNNLVLYRAGSPAKPLWNTRTNGKNTRKVLLQQNGNLVIIGAPSSPGNPYVWQSNSGSAQNSYCKLVVQDNGNLEIICSNKVVWDTGTGVPPANILTMKKGDRIYSPNRNVFLNYQHDNNLVLYQVGSPAIPLWNTKTSGKHTANVILTEIGNLVITKPNYPTGPYVWQSYSGNKYHRFCRLEVMNNGNMAIICGNGTVWETKTRVK